VTTSEAATVLDIHERLEAFYADFGFATVSAPYEEDGIMHVDMVR